MKSTFAISIEILIKSALKKESFYDMLFALGEVKGVIEMYNKLSQFRDFDYEMLIEEVTHAKDAVIKSIKINNSIKEAK